MDRQYWLNKILLFAVVTLYFQDQTPKYRGLRSKRVLDLGVKILKLLTANKRTEINLTGVFWVMIISRILEFEINTNK